MSVVERLAKKVRSARLPLRAPASRDDIEKFEAEAGLPIPEDYRDFLLRIGNGGTPPCRLVRLSWWDASYWLDDTRPTMAALPCVVTPSAEDHGTAWLDRTNVSDWKERWDREEWSPMFGTIAIAEIGCGLFYSMIMTGALRGRIFSWGDAALVPPIFCKEDCFGEWFEACLDRLLTGYPVHFLDGRIR